MSKDANVERPKSIINEGEAQNIRNIEQRDGRRAAILAGLKAGLGIAAILTILNTGKLVQPVKASECPLVIPQYDDFLDLSVNPSAPASGTTRLFSKSGLVYRETPDGTVSPLGNVMNAADYMIYIDANDSNKTKALNGYTGAIDFEGTEPALVINNAINALTNGGKVFIRAGTYVLASLNVMVGGKAGNAAIGSTTVSGIELCGEGTATHLQLGTNQNGTVICIVGVNDWYIHDLQVDANRANQNGNGVDIELMGMNLYNTTNTIVQNCYVHDCKTYGIQLYGVTSKLLNCYVQNCNANGIILYGGSQLVVANNIVTGASDVGLDISGQSASVPITDVTCEGNVVQNINLDDSPFTLNTGIGILAGDNGYVLRGTASGNIVDNCNGWGLAADPTGTNSDIIFEDNQAYNCGRGIYTANTTRMKIAGNLVDTTTLTNNSGYGIFVDAGCTDASVENNTVSNTATTAVLIASPNVKITGNILIVASGISAGTYTVYFGSSGTSVANNCLFANNLLDLTGAAGAYGIYVSSGLIGLIISQNELVGNSPISNLNPVNTSGNYGSFIGNSITNFTGFSDNGVGNYIEGNYGLNPINEMSTPINTSNNTIGTNGSTSTPTPNIDYVVQGPPITVTWSGGSEVSVTIKDGAGNPVLTSAPSPQRLPYGWKINFGSFSAAPTVTAFGE